jgi:hypothetical protein
VLLNKGEIMSYIVKIKNAPQDSWADGRVGEIFQADLWDHHNKNERRHGRKIFVGVRPEYGWLPTECCEAL